MEENQNPFPSFLQECGFILKVVFLSTIFLSGVAAYLLALYQADLQLALSVGAVTTLLWSFIAARSVPRDLRKRSKDRWDYVVFFLPTLSSFGTTYGTIYLLSREEYTVGFTLLALGLAAIHWGNNRYQRRLKNVR